MIAAAVVMPASFYVGGQRWGTVGSRDGLCVMDPLIASMLYWRCVLQDRAVPRAYLAARWPAFSGRS